MGVLLGELGDRTELVLGLFPRDDLGLQSPVGCSQLVGALLLGDVDDGHTAAFSLPLTAWGGDALEQHIHGLPVAKELDLAGPSVAGRQHPFAELGKGGAVLHGQELPKPLVDRRLARQAQQGGPGHVDFQDPRPWSQRKYPTGAKSNRS